jgi:hypothetical protein
MMRNLKSLFAASFLAAIRARRCPSRRRRLDRHRTRRHHHHRRHHRLRRRRRRHRARRRRRYRSISDVGVCDRGVALCDFLKKMDLHLFSAFLFCHSACQTTTGLFACLFVVICSFKKLYLFVCLFQAVLSDCENVRTNLIQPKAPSLLVRVHVCVCVCVCVCDLCPKYTILSFRSFRFRFIPLKQQRVGDEVDDDATDAAAFAARQFE